MPIDSRTPNNHTHYTTGDITPTSFKPKHVKPHSGAGGSVGRKRAGEWGQEGGHQVHGRDGNCYPTATLFGAPISGESGRKFGEGGTGFEGSSKNFLAP